MNNFFAGKDGRRRLINIFSRENCHDRRSITTISRGKDGRRSSMTIFSGEKVGRRTSNRRFPENFGGAGEGSEVDLLMDGWMKSHRLRGGKMWKLGRKNREICFLTLK